MAQYRVLYTYREEWRVDVEAESHEEAERFAMDEIFEDDVEIVDVFLYED